MLFWASTALCTLSVFQLQNFSLQRKLKPNKEIFWVALSNEFIWWCLTVMFHCIYAVIFVFPSLIIPQVVREMLSSYCLAQGLAQNKTVSSSTEWPTGLDFLITEWSMDGSCSWPSLQIEYMLFSSINHLLFFIVKLTHSLIFQKAHSPWKKISFKRLSLLLSTFISVTSPSISVSHEYHQNIESVFWKQLIF